jgi:hypothetical protein
MEWFYRWLDEPLAAQTFTDSLAASPGCTGENSEPVKRLSMLQNSFEAS